MPQLQTDPTIGSRIVSGMAGHIGVFLAGAFVEYSVVESRVPAHVPDSATVLVALLIVQSSCQKLRMQRAGGCPERGLGWAISGLQMAKANVIGVDA